MAGDAICLAALPLAVTHAGLAAEAICAASLAVHSQYGEDVCIIAMPADRVVNGLDTPSHREYRDGRPHRHRGAIWPIAFRRRHRPVRRYLRAWRVERRLTRMARHALILVEGG